MPGLFLTLRCRGLALVVVALGLAACGRPDDGVLSGRTALDVSGSYDGRRTVTVPFEAVPGRRYVARLQQVDADAELALLDGERERVRVAGPARALGTEYLAFTAPADAALRFEVRALAAPARSAGYRLQVYALPADLPGDVATAFERWTAAGAAAASPPDGTAALENLRAVQRVWERHDQALAADVGLQAAAVEYWLRDDWAAAVADAERAAAEYARIAAVASHADATVLAALARVELAREQRGANPAAAAAEFAAAQAAFAAARAAYTQAARPVAAAMTFVYAGSALYYDYDLAGAARSFAAGERALAAAGAEEERRVALGNLAVASADRGDYQAAASVYEQLLPLLAARRDELLAATLLNGAATLLPLGDAERALGRYLEALQIADERDLARIRINARIGLGAAHLQLGQPELAAQHLQSALLDLGEGDRHTRVVALLRLGDADRQLGRPARADAAHAEAAAIAAKLGAPALRARIALVQGDAHAGAGRPARAIASYDEVLAYPVAETQAVVARALIGRGQALRALGRADAAAADLERAATLSAANGYRETLIAANYERAKLALQRGDRDAALSLARQAADDTRTLTATMTNPDNRVTLGTRLRAAQALVVDLLATDARRLAAAGEHEAAAARSSAALYAADAALPAPPDRHGPPAAGARQQQLATALAERRYRYESLAERNATPTPTMQAIEREIAALRSQLARLGAAGPAAATAAADVNAANAREAGPDAPGGAAPLDAAALQARMPAESVLLVYSLGAQRSWRWTVSRERFALDVLPPAAEIDRQVESLLAAVQALHAPVLARSAAGALATAVLPPDLPAGARLLIVPDGSLGAVPWALLGDDARPALQLASFTAVSGRDAEPWPAAPLRLALFGDPIFAADDPRLGARAVPASSGALTAALPRLPGTARELAAIAALAPAGSVRISTGAAATRDAVLALPGDAVDVLHLATHATLDTQVPALASIVLSRRDARGLELAGDLRPADIVALAARPRLVVLSACDAAAEPSRSAAGLMNLTRAFLAGGTRYVVASRWAVGDASAIALMTEFYRGLLQDGLPPEAALARAQRTLAATPQWRAPFHWAGFVVTGAAP